MACRMHGVELFAPSPLRPYMPAAVFLPHMETAEVCFDIDLRCIDDGIFTFFVRCTIEHTIDFQRYVHLTAKAARSMLESLKRSPEKHDVAMLHIPHPVQALFLGHRRTSALVLRLLQFAFDTPRMLADPILHDWLGLDAAERDAVVEIAFHMHVWRQRHARVHHKAMRQVRAVVHAMHVRDWKYAAMISRLCRHDHQCTQPMRLPLVVYDHDMEFQITGAHAMTRPSSSSSSSSSQLVLGPGGKQYFTLRTPAAEPHNVSLVDATNTSLVQVHTIQPCANDGRPRVALRRIVPTCSLHPRPSSPSSMVPQTHLETILVASRDPTSTGCIRFDPPPAAADGMISGLVFGLHQVRAQRYHTWHGHGYELVATDMASGFTFYMGAVIPSSCSPKRRFPFRDDDKDGSYSLMVYPGHDLLVVLAMAVALAQLVGHDD
ncbi:Aste57867_19133 [Aphanomyces stellatus]|uniref:Aste57867_19133 protein n=1 Tax=Aphanomyces stellatus TaxID=120398 RepID=A0A485LC52_9STRA|nr:hypothetical protein As57867_019069 [Aphanomyces stellatus]VFT95856.1 Aste57867_19133 [Aphanomyces stellatus]